MSRTYTSNDRGMMLAGYLLGVGLYGADRIRAVLNYPDACEEAARVINERRGTTYTAADMRSLVDKKVGNNMSRVTEEFSRRYNTKRAR